jgi:hypothetical protein
VHAEAARPLRDRGTDRTEADHADGEALDGAPELRLPLVLHLRGVDLRKALPHREETTHRELGDRRGGHPSRVGDRDVVGDIGLGQVVDAGADGLNPLQLRCQVADRRGKIERERGVGARPHLAGGVGELVFTVGHVVRETAQVGLRDELDVGKALAQRLEHRVVGVPRKRHHDSGHARAPTSFKTPGACTGASVLVR